MRVLILASALGLTAAIVSADVKVLLHDGQMDVHATRASVAEILDRIATQTGMKVIYDGPRPQKVLTKAVKDRTPADAVLGILEGEGLNFAVILNPAGTQIETLLVTGPSKIKRGTGPSPQPPMPMPGQSEGWSVEVDEPPPPPPPAPPVDNGELPPPPPGDAGQNKDVPAPPSMTLPSPSPMPSSPFTPQGPGPILLPPVGGVQGTPTPPR